MRKKLLLFVLLPALALSSLAVVLAVLLWHEPAFYRQAAVTDHRRARADAKQFVSAASQLVSDIQNESAWSAAFSQAQINAFLADDFKRKHSERLPRGTSDLRVALESDHALLGFRTSLGPLDLVVSVSVQVWVPEPNVLAVKLQRVAAGAVPLPLEYLMSKLTEAARRSRWPIQWKQHEGRPLALVHLPGKSDGDTVELCQLFVTDQWLHLQGNCAQKSSADPVALQRSPSSRHSGRH